ncbi:unnamed protein product [Amoebophrya sp. A25]|nr:unnamed protein product [Amoebophrya sp. A25]|eukprot:GSA25T00001331001.1
MSSPLTASSAEEAAKVSDLLTRLKEKEEDAPQEACLRFLRARNGNVDKAFDLLHKHLLWVKEMRPLEITQNDITVPLNAGSMLVLGVNQFGNAVMFGSSRAWNPHQYSLETCLKFITYYMCRMEEHVLKKTGASQFVFVFDVSYWALWHGRYLSYSTGLLKTLQDHFPERLKHAFVLNAPSLFQGFWKLVKGMLDKKTSNKLSFINIPKGHKFQTSGTGSGGTGVGFANSSSSAKKQSLCYDAGNVGATTIGRTLPKSVSGSTTDPSPSTTSSSISSGAPPAAFATAKDGSKSTTATEGDRVSYVKSLGDFFTDDAGSEDYCRFFRPDRIAGSFVGDMMTTTDGDASTPASPQSPPPADTLGMKKKVEVFLREVPLDILPDYYGGTVKPDDIPVPNLPGQPNIACTGPWKHRY